MTPFGTTVLKSVAFAIVMNAAVGIIAGWVLGYQLYLGDAVRILSGTAAVNTVPPERYRWLNEHPWPVLSYFCATYLLAFVLAVVRREAVRRLELDSPNSRFFPEYFRQQAPWYYLFSGIDVGGGTRPDAVVVSVLVSLKDATYLYTGLLEDYEVKDDGELDRIILSETMRRKILEDRAQPDEDSNQHDQSDSNGASQKERFYPIDGDRFILRASEWTTLNVKFLAVEQLPGEPHGSDGSRR
ncbi:hypothetical protein DDK22_00410 [Cupriavidus necator]|uniref:Uncharacterized protein n=2 Tax=Cupriavidus necator TaxID=106590 RepID=A0A367PRA3_CUPNE|nr:hypothetical protein DDK22_00410 [Cupriavidus necator]